MDLFSHLVEWTLRGVVIVAAGQLPLSITSQPVIAWLTVFGTGWLIASSLGSFFGSVVFSAAASTLSPGAVGSLRFLLVAPAITHIAGVLSMLVVERRLCSRALDSGRPPEWDSDTLFSPNFVAHDGAMGLRARQETEDIGAQVPHASHTTRASGPHQRRVYLFIFAFVIGEIVRGISVGYGAMAPPWKPDNTSNDKIAPGSLPGPMTEFFLRSVLEAATALGFATTLLSASLPIAQCRRYVLIYGAVHPLVALLSYTVMALLKLVPTNESSLSFIILSMKHLTVGFFVYAALIVRALIINSRTTTRSGLLAKIITMVAGALLPYILPRLLWALYSMGWAASRREAPSG